MSEQLRALWSLFAFVFATTAACGFNLTPTRAAMPLSGAPWTVPAPNLALSVVPLQQQCRDHVERLRSDAESALKGREARRVTVALTSAALSLTGLALAASSTSATEAKAISGYVVAGVGVLTQAIDAVVPAKRAEAIYAAWRKASDYFEAGEKRLSVLNSCTAYEKPLEEPECNGLDRDVRPSVPVGPMAATPAGPLDDAEIRERFKSIRGIHALNAIAVAYQTCAAVSPIDFQH